MQKLYYFSEYLQDTYQIPMQRIPLDLALGCPNRANGGFGPGCIFCAEDGARARHLCQVGPDLAAQVRRGIDYVRSRYQNNSQYIAYFQAFTSTNAPVERLRKLYSEALSAADFKLLIIATRPDALPPATVDYLAGLAQQYPVWVELGIQSANDKTLKEINRGHDFAAVQTACERLAAKNIKIAGHFILGLPGETFDDWMYTAEQAAQLPLSGIKMHQLMVLKNTELARRYHQDNNYLKLLNEYEYAAGLKAFLRKLPDNWPLMRITADADSDDLIGPEWWMKKGQFLKFFNDYFYSDTPADGGFVAAETADGSRTLYHPLYRQHFHSLAGADSEAEKKFAEPSKLEERLQVSGTEVKLLDVGFGLGGNVFSAWKIAQKYPDARLEITSLEIDRRTLQAARSLYADNAPEQELFSALLETGSFIDGNFSVKLLIGDGRKSIQTLPEKYFDLIWLDAFSPDVNPELWSHQYFRQCARVLRKDGLLLSYSSSPAVRGGLLKNHFFVAETTPFGRKRGGTVASLSPLPDYPAIPEKEYHIIMDSTAGTPYSDPDLSGSAQDILAHHRKLIERLRRQGVPKWYKAK